MRAERDRLALPRQGGKADDRALGRLTVDPGQHHVGLAAGEGAFALDRRQLPGIAEHQDRLAEGQQIGGHLLADHRHLVEHQEIGIAQQRLLVEQEARLVQVAQAQLEMADLRLGEEALARAHGTEAGAQVLQILLDARDLLRRGLRAAVDQAVDGRGRRPLAGHHQRRLAGEGAIEHTARSQGVALAVEAELGDGMGGERGLARAGIAEEPEDLLLAAAMPEPVLDAGDGAGLFR